MPNFAQIIRPSSGDPIYQGGASDYIRWVTQGYTRVRFEFSEDAGASWKSVSGRGGGQRRHVYLETSQRYHQDSIDQND